MPAGESVDDPLSRWLSGDGLAALDAIMGGALDVVGVVDRQLTMRYVNWTAPDLTRDSVIGRSVFEVIAPEYHDVARATYTQVLETGVGARFETMYRDSDGVLFWEIRVGPIHSEGEVVGIVVITSDVTEQRRADADRDRFFSLSLDMLVVVSPQGHYKRVNPAFGEALGYAVSELLGTPFPLLMHPDDRARSFAAFEGVVRGTPVSDFEDRFRRRDGQYRVFSWRATADPITGDVYAVARDVTDHRTTEGLLRHAQKMEAVGQLAGGIAHDFNNLLQAVLANTELALQGEVPPPADIAECLGEIEGASRRAADLTQQLLAFSRGQPLRLVPVDLNALIRGLMKMLRRLLPESIAIDSIPGHNLATVNADPGQLEQVIVNLCVNARDAMEQGGQLTIETENVLLNGRYCELHPGTRPGRYVLLRVSDTGVGMSAAVQERAFEPFFTTKSANQGTGLGLSTVYGIVQQHDGWVQLYSEPGEGTIFKIYLPADSRLATDVGHTLEALPPKGQETILLAEDEERIRRVTVQILERAGYRTIAASNGIEAVRLLRERDEPIHLVLLDLVMPELGGPETWEQLQALRPGLRVLFTSGYADQRYRKRLPPGAEVLEKPFRVEALLTSIRKILDT
jgi:PAS domain S-box-containing protein